MMRLTAVFLASAAIALAAPEAHAGMLVSFSGRLDFVSAHDEISSYLAVGDRFSGSFTYDPGAVGRPYETPLPSDSAQAYDSAITSFTLAFTSGNSQGHSINGFVPTRHDLESASGEPLSTYLSLEDNVDVRFEADVTDLRDFVKGQIAHPDEVFRPGLSQHSLSFELMDFEEAMLDSAALADWDPNRYFAPETLIAEQNSYLIFGSTTNGALQFARFQFSTFHAEEQPEVVPVFEEEAAIDASTQEASFFGGTAEASNPGALDVQFEAAPEQSGEFAASYARHTATTLSQALAYSSGYDLANFATGAGGEYQLWDLDFTGTLSPGSDVTLSFLYDDAGLTPEAEASLGIWHYGEYGPDGNRQWKWLRDEIDTEGNVITVTVDHFSPFAAGFQSLQVVPEPSGLVLFGLGLFGFAGMVRRKRVGSLSSFG